ncbi:MAG: rhodanese-like domain-containing protein [Desulfopila sp.]
MKETFIPVQKAFCQVFLLLIMACFIALAVNHWRGTPLPLFGDWSVTARLTDPEGDNLLISFDQAKQMFDRKGAVFVDARPRSQYKDGHISGALSLPWQDAANTFIDVAARLEEKDTLITYCDGEDCALSHDLAMFLKDMGYVDVRVLVNGWTVWQEAGLPVQKESGDQ